MIERPTLKDWYELIKLESDVFEHDRIVAGEFWRYIQRWEDCDIFVMRREGFLTGYGIVRYEPRSKGCNLYSLCSKEAKAYLILQDLEIAAKSKGKHYITLEVKEDNWRGVAFYIRNGYRLIKSPDKCYIKNFYEDGTTALRFIKYLKG